jgi:hypothetical protein
MSRYTYRSQPTLQRTPDALPRWVRPTAMWSAVAVALVIASRAFTVATMEDAGPPPTIVAAAPPAPVQAAPAAPVAVAGFVQAPAGTSAEALAARLVPVEKTHVEKTHLAKTRKLATAVPPPRQAATARSPADYGKALEAYAAQERSAGFSWARQNRVTVRDYCRATSRRTTAFMQGCMAYLETGAG